MTLTKAVEAARHALKQSAEYLRQIPVDFERGCESWQFARQNEDALAALPDKPMAEDEIYRIIYDAYHKENFSAVWNVIKALKAANVLYVAEDKS